MTVPTHFNIAFSSEFANAFPELSVSWSAKQAPAPTLTVLNEPLAQDLGIPPASLRTPEGVRLLIGNELPEGAAPVAQGYSGHQFGSYTPRLGDGRALLLGELPDRTGRVRDVHLKGSGRTPFARGGADGLAALGPMLREYLVSEAMHALGIPSSRALAVVSTGEDVRRGTSVPGAVLTRVATSHIRVGSFQYARASGDLELVRRLADYAITRHYPESAEVDNPYSTLLEAVATAQARLVAHWMLVGFVHGVMNTDNMTVSGESIDYGPCAFIDTFDPGSVFSSIDQGGRYAYRNQPVVAEWNLARFAEALLPLLAGDEDHAVELAQQTLQKFRRDYSVAWFGGMKDKLGLPEHIEDDQASSLMDEVLALMYEESWDYTTFFRGLGDVARGETSQLLEVDSSQPMGQWLSRWRSFAPDPAIMDRTNPVHIPRNHLVEEALEAATAGNMEPFQQLLKAVTAPYTPRAGMERYAAPAPKSFGPYQTFCGT